MTSLPGDKGETGKPGKRAILLLSLLVIMSFVPLAILAFASISTAAIPHDLVDHLSYTLSVIIIAASAFIFLLALCLEKRGINKPELWLSIVYSLLGLAFAVIYLVVHTFPDYVPIWRLSLEYSLPFGIAASLGIMGAAGKKSGRALIFIPPLISLAIMITAYLYPVSEHKFFIESSPIANPYELLPLTLILLAAFAVYPRILRRYTSYTLYAFWVSAVPDACGLLLSIFTNGNQSSTSLYLLAYLVLSRGVIICGLLGDILRQESTILHLEHKVSRRDKEISIISKQRDARENALETSQQQVEDLTFYKDAFHSACSSLRAIALLVSPSGKLIEANQFTSELLGLPENVGSANFTLGRIIEDTDFAENPMSVLEGKTSATRPLTLKNLKSNESFDITASLTPVQQKKNGNDDISCLVITALDKREQKAVKDENHRLKWQLSVSPDPIIEFTTAGEITFQNKPAAAIGSDTASWSHPLLKNLQGPTEELKAGKLDTFERKHICSDRYFQQTLTFNELFERYVLHSSDITESGKKLAESEKVVNYAAWLQQQFCIHYNEPYKLLNIMLKQSLSWLQVNQAVICTENDGRLTRISTFPESTVRSGMTDPHSDLLMQMLSNVHAGPFEIPSEPGSDQPCMGYHLSIDEKPWGVIYFVGPNPSMDNRVRQNILANIGIWMTLVISQTRSKDVAMRHYYLSPTAMFTCLHNGTITQANTAFEKLFNVHEDRVSEHAFDDFLSQSDKNRASEFLSIPVGDWMRESVVRMETADHKIVPYRLFCTADPLTELLFCILVPEKSSNGQTGLGHEGMARIGREISHPLNCVVGMTELLEVSGLDVRQHNFVEQIRQSADMLIGLSETIHNYSLLRSGDLELNITQFDLQDLLELVLSSFESEAASKTVSLFLHYSSNTPRCFWGDRERIASILRNLIGNAVRLTDLGYVSAIVRINNHPETQASSVQITIEDSGSGIPADQLPQVFNEYSKFSRDQHFSCGLGLATAKDLANTMNGDITVDSTVGQGSIFTLNLQIQPAPAMRDSQTTVCELNIHKAMLLMTDPMAMQVIDTTLNDAALEKETYTDADSALAALQASADAGVPYNLVIVDEDIRHPEVNNFAKLAKQCAGNDKLKLVKYSPDGYRTREEREDGLFDETILSPVTPQRIMKTLRRVYAPDNPELQHYSSASEKTLELQRPISILIADSDHMNREIMRGLLEPSNALVDISTDGSRTVELACSHKYDLIFTIIDLPHMDGYEVTKAIRKVEAHKRHTPIIAILQVDDPKIRKLGRSAGIDTFIVKPVRRRNLNRILHEFIVETPMVNSTPTMSQTETVDLYPLEIDRAATEMGVKKKLYVRIFRIFTDSLDEHMVSISKHFKKRDEANLSQAARKLGRSAANLHLFELKNSCLRVEELADSGEWDALGQQIEAIKKHVKQLKDLAQNLLS